MSDVDTKWWWDIAQSVGIVLIGVGGWLRKPGEDAGHAVTKLHDDFMRELHALGDRMSGEVSDLRTAQGRLDERIGYAPSRDELTEVAGDVKAIKAELKGLINTQSTQSTTLSRIEDFLLNGHRR